MKEKLTEIYDWFEWHGIGQLLVVLMFSACLLMGFYAFQKFLDNRILQGDLERLNISNNHIAAVSLNGFNQVVAIDNIYYQGICELTSVRFNTDEVNTCYYKCWWNGVIGSHPSYGMDLPCKIKSQ